MATWREEADAIIARVDATLSPDLPLPERKKAIRAARPYWFAATSWGTKTWGAAQKSYLAKHGQKSDAAVPPKHLSPMERMMASSLPTPKD